jgi:hypothetical protein
MDEYTRNSYLDFPFMISLVSQSTRAGGFQRDRGYWLAGPDACGFGSNSVNFRCMSADLEVNERLHWLSFE